VAPESNVISPEPPVAADSLGTLKDRVRGGMAWTALAQVLSQVTRIAVLVVLARLLTPHEYGLAAMVFVFSGLVLLFADLGFSAAVVQRRELTDTDCSTAFWINVAAGAILTLVGVLAAGPIAAFYGEPAVKPLFEAVSLAFLLTSVQSTQIALLKKSMRFRALEIRKMIGTAASAAVAIAVAVEGAGAWAIIASQLSFAAVSGLLVWTVSPWRPSFTFSRASLRALGGYGTKVFSWDALFYLNRNMDNLLIGRFLGSAPLGAYNVAYNATIFPIDQFAGPIREVLFPAFARLQHDPRQIGEAWLRGTRLVAAVLIPALAGLAVVAPDFVPVVLGHRWHQAVPVVQILVWVALLKSLQRLNGTVLQACGRAGWGLLFAAVAFVASMAAFAIGLRWGIVGVAACYAVATTLIQPFYTWLTARAAGLSLRAVTRVLAGVVQAATVMVLVTVATRIVLVHQGLPSAPRLVLTCTVGAIVFVPLCAWWAPAVRADIRGFTRRGRGEVRPAADASSAVPEAELRR
jgi:O-antigen/teichoic acid export membrane protein